MNYRLAKIWSTETLAAAAVRTIPLRGLKPISELIVVIRYTNNGSTVTEHPALILKHLQIVDGSEVIVNLTGIQAAALEYFHYKRPGFNVITYVNDNIGTMEFRIPFGRWLWDTELALDPARFNNLQLIVDMDESLGGSAPDASSLTIVAKMFDGKAVNPSGCLVARQHYTYSLVSSGVEPIDLPTDRVIKMIMFQSLARTKAINSQMNNIKISEDNDNKIWFDESVSYLIKHLQDELPPYEENVLFPSTATSGNVYVTPCYEEYANITGILDADGYDNGVPLYGGKISVGGTGTKDVIMGVRGWAPHGAIAIETGDPWDMSDWFVPRVGGSVKAFVTGGSSVLSSSTAQVVLQSLRKY